MADRKGILSYELAGAGRPVIFIHGLTYDRRIWRPVVDLLSLDFTCISVDLPGHGQSPDLDEYDLDSVVLRVKGVSDALDLGEPVIVGNSIGACIAAVYAARFGAHAIVLSEHSLQFAPLARSLRAIEPQLRGQGFAGICTAIEATFRIDSLPGESRILVRESSRQRQQIVLGYWEWLLSSTDPAELDRQFRPTLDAIRCPALSIHGSDPGEGYAQWLSERVANVQVEVWDDAGHFPQLMYPARFADSVRRTVAIASVAG